MAVGVRDGRCGGYFPGDDACRFLFLALFGNVTCFEMIGIVFMVLCSCY